MAAPKRIPAFQFYAHAWLSSMSVTMMPAEVEGTYIRLLSHLWVGLTQGDGRLLPIDPKQLRMLTKLSESQWKKFWPALEEHFPLSDDETGRINPTLHAVWVSHMEFRDKQRENGANGGRPPKNQPPPKEKPKRNPTETQAFPVGSVSRNPNETSETETETGSGFESEQQSSQQTTTNDSRERDRIAVVVAANAGVAKKWGAQPNPIRASAPNSDEFVRAILDDGIDIEFAAAVVFEYASTCRPSNGKAPGQMTYFTEYVRRRWSGAQEQLRAAEYVHNPQAAIRQLPEVNAFHLQCIKYAQAGSLEYQLECQKLGLVWEKAS